MKYKYIFSKSKKFSKCLSKQDYSYFMSTRSKKVPFNPVATRTNHYANSPIPRMVALANGLGITLEKRLKLRSGTIIML